MHGTVRPGDTAVEHRQRCHVYDGHDVRGLARERRFRRRVGGLWALRDMKPMLVLAACLAGCSGTTPTQILTGNVTTTGAIAVRAVSGSTVITAGRVRTDGSFTLSLPAGAEYRLEVLTSTGVQPVVTSDGTTLANLTFRVCTPTSPWDMGGVGSAGSGSGSDTPPVGCSTPNGVTGPCPPPCDPTTDTNCPTPCDPTTDTNCPAPPPPPPHCDPTTDGTCPPPPPPVCNTNNNGSGCPPQCDPTTQADCPTPPPPCVDPTDTTSCQDPCMTDPSQCGCATNGSDASCWPPPQPPQCDSSGNCGPDGSCMPAHPPHDFGCTGSTGS